MAKPNRTLRQSKAPTPAQVRRQKDKIAEQKTQQMVEAAYRRSYRHAQVAIARQEAKKQAMRDAGIEPQPAQQQPPVAPAAKQKPPKAAKPATRGKKPSGRKPPRR